MKKIWRFGQNRTSVQGKSKIIVFTVILLSCQVNVAFANSSWYWVTHKPLTILPWVALGTIIIEVVMIHCGNSLARLPISVLAITLANLISFLFPYVLLGAIPTVFDDFGFWAQLDYLTSHLPYYTVGFGFLFFTLIIEIPLVYVLLKKNAAKKLRLLLWIAAANCITTLLVAFVERTLCSGRW